MSDAPDGYGYDPTTVEPIPVSTAPIDENVPSKYTVPMKYLPPVGQQGTAESPGYPGSCAAWATTYGLATYTAAKKGLVDPSSSSGQASPAYIYIQALKQLNLKKTASVATQLSSRTSTCCMRRERRRWKPLLMWQAAPSCGSTTATPHPPAIQTSRSENRRR